MKIIWAGCSCSRAGFMTPVTQNLLESTEKPNLQSGKLTEQEAFLSQERPKPSTAKIHHASI